MGLSASDCSQGREHIHLLLIADAERSLADIAAGRTYPADAAIVLLQRRRSCGTTAGASRSVVATARKAARNSG